jgi:cytochrome c peroxidase
VVAIAGCGAESEAPLPALPWERAAFPEVVEPADNPSTPAKIELGRLLFYDPILSRDRAVACASCHSELWGLGDGLSLAVGVDGSGPTGPGRDGPNKTTRNAQTLWNVAFRSTLFWDGRSPSLEDQALAPIASPLELDRDPDEVATDLAAIAGYRELFGAAFPEELEPNAANLARALAAFQRSLRSLRAPYDRFAAGDDGALSAEAQRGMWLFAEAGCHGCHVPPTFASDGYANRGLGDDDEGRYAVTGSPAERGAFRVPTLRNLRETGPYFHDGSVATLAEAVLHEAERSFDEGRSRLLLADEVAAIALFLDKALMDRSAEPHRPREVPSGLEVPADGFRIPR